MAAADVATLVGIAAVGEGKLREITRVMDAGATRTRIAEAAAAVSDAVSEIASSSSVQANGIGEMSQVVARTR